MNPPYDLNKKILKLVSDISFQLGELKSYTIPKATPMLRKQNKIKTIQASLEIEGNYFDTDLVSAVLEGKRVVGAKKELLEVQNAIKVYEEIVNLKPNTVQSFLKAHKILMDGLIDNPGRFRNKGVGVFSGDKFVHMAPPHTLVSAHIDNLFDYIKNSDDDMLILSCVAHYEIEFIHPFSDGNGRIGRLWQSLLLAKENAVFEYLPFETVIRDTQQEYYKALADANKEGKATKFIEYMLATINQSLKELVIDLNNGKPQTAEERLELYITYNKREMFTRKNYMDVWREISPATASRDLQHAVETKKLEKEGDKNTTKYKVKE
ncbi:MAG: Fic family protein [Lishizhenia sp.]